MMKRLMKLSTAKRVLLLVISSAAFLFLVGAAVAALIVGYSFFVLPPLGWLLLFSLGVWLALNTALYSMLCFSHRLMNSTRNLLANLCSCITLVIGGMLIAMLMLMHTGVRLSTASPDPIKDRPGLILYGSPQDKSCTVYFYKTSGNLISGMDIEVMLEPADNLGEEIPVCHLNHVRGVHMVWKSNRVYIINGATYYSKFGSDAGYGINSFSFGFNIIEE